MKKSSVIQVLNEKYADIFIAYFDRISNNPKDPFLRPMPYPQQNATGHVYSGINSLVTSMKAQEMGYDYPVWMTVNQANSAGISILAGEHGTPIKYNSQWLLDLQSGKKSSLTMEEYDALSADEKLRYKVMNSLKTYHVFNLGQTDFDSKYPDKAQELREQLSLLPSACCSEELLDNMIAQDNWMCPVRVLDSFVLPGYLMSKDVIVSPPKEAFIDQSAFYSSLLYMMSLSSGHESRGAWLSDGIRDATGKLQPSSLDRLSAQLSSAMLGSLMGITTPLNHDNLSYVKRWVTEISSDPTIIKTAISNSTKAIGDVSRNLGLGVRKGIDFSKVLGIMDKALEEVKKSKSAKKLSRRVRSR